MPRNRIYLTSLFAVLLAGCSATTQKRETMSEEQRTALSRDYADAVKQLTDGGGTKLPPYPTAIPSEGPDCKALVSRDRQMGLSLGTVRLLTATGKRPWAIYRFDVDAKGTVSNVRLLQSSGPKSVEFDFKRSIESWKFAPSVTAKDCIAEMKIS